MPFRRYNNREEYLKKAIPKGFHKKLFIFNGEVVGQIEYAPAEVSGYPILDDYNCNELYLGSEKGKETQFWKTTSRKYDEKRRRCGWFRHRRVRKSLESMV